MPEGIGTARGLDFEMSYVSNGMILAQNGFFTAYINFASSLDFDTQITVYKRKLTSGISLTFPYGDYRPSVAVWIQKPDTSSLRVSKTFDSIVTARQVYKNLVVGFVDILEKATPEIPSNEAVSAALRWVNAKLEDLFRETGLR